MSLLGEWILDSEQLTILLSPSCQQIDEVLCLYSSIWKEPLDHSAIVALLIRSVKTVLLDRLNSRRLVGRVIQFICLNDSSDSLLGSIVRVSLNLLLELVQQPLL